MKMKKIIIISFLLLAILAVSTVSAEDNNVTSDDLKVSDDVPLAYDYDSEYHCIEINDEKICINENNNNYVEDEYVAGITLPSNAKGYFKILNGDEVVAQTRISTNDEHWEVYDDDLEGTLYLSDFNLSKIKNGDELSFKFFELKTGQYVEVESFTIICKVTLTNSYMSFSIISGGIPDAEIQITNIDLSKADENFTYLNITQKQGTFIISIITDSEDFNIFKENLNTTERPYVEFDDEDGNHYYSFGYSLTDINNYIAQEYAGDSINDLIAKNVISSDDEMSFDIYKDENNEESNFFSESKTITIEDGKIFFGDDEEEVNVDYDELDIVMNEGWNKTTILKYIVKKGLKGKIVIYLNDNQTPAFNKNISDMIPTDESDEDFNYYNITIADLNINQSGEYVLCYYFDDENGNHIYSYYEEEPEILTLQLPQTTAGDNATIWVNPVPISVDEDKILISINTTDDDEANVTIYVDEASTPFIINLSECIFDSENYTITSKKLNLEVGNHTLNITCKGTNLIANVTILTDLVIELTQEDNIIYTTFNDAFAFIFLADEDITYRNITGKINITLTNSEGNVLPTIEKDFDDLTPDFDLEAFIIRAKDISMDLNEKYFVVVKYFDGNKGFVQTQGNVTFKIFNASEYQTSINDTIENENIITFNAMPLEYMIMVEIDENRTVEINQSNLNIEFDQQGNKVYSIKQNYLGLTDGSHSINVYIETNDGRKDLAYVNVSVDLVENIDPALTISVADIEEGNVAYVLITTNSTFTGNVTVEVANKNYTVNVDNGQGNLSITNLKANTYTATAFFTSDAIFNESIKNTTFKVTAKKVPPVQVPTVIKLTLNKVKVKKSAKKIVLKATLKINGNPAYGKKIIFKFNGKKLTGKTNNKGVSKVTIKKNVLKKLKVGKKVKYQASYGKNIIKKTVKVKK